MLRSLAVLFLLVPSTLTASCGGSGIPFRFEVLPSGTPVLGCGTPQCFGADAGGRSILHDSRFNPGADGEDGFFREGDMQRIRSRFDRAPAQQAECPSGFDSTTCSNPLTWVGGFLSSPDGRYCPSVSMTLCLYVSMYLSSSFSVCLSVSLNILFCNSVYYLYVSLCLSVSLIILFQSPSPVLPLPGAPVRSRSRPAYRPRRRSLQRR